MLTNSDCDSTGSCSKPIEELVSLHCLRPQTSEFFEVAPTDPSIATLFNFSIPFGFVIHGYVDSFPGDVNINGQGWVLRTAVDWAANGINVCAVNWGPTSSENRNYYFVLQINTRRVADYLIDVIENFARYGLTVSQTSLVGHSLGAHISGKVGAALKRNGKVLKAIYGLDPAGICFTIPCTAPLYDRLDDGDAAMVQCIHSNSGIYGQASPCGCVDFFLNSGVFQPGASDPRSAHYFACMIFDWTLYKYNQCIDANSTEIVGIHSRGICGIYQVDTRAQEPYCPVSRSSRFLTKLFAYQRFREYYAMRELI